MTDPSRSQIDSAGKQLQLIDLDDPTASDLEAVRIADSFRRGHREPLQQISAQLFDATHKFDERPEVGQRLKQLDSVAAKLRRETTRLSQMEDIGGCRIILPTISHVYEMADALKKKLDIRSDDDYIASPKRDTGYRARHLVVLENGFRIEVQLRTHLQNEWADLVESSTVPATADIKHGEGPAQVIEFFKELASFYAALEVAEGQDDPPDSAEIQALYEAVLPELRKLVVQQKKTFTRLSSRLTGRSK